MSEKKESLIVPMFIFTLLSPALMCVAFVTTESLIPLLATGLLWGIGVWLCVENARMGGTAFWKNPVNTINSALGKNRK